jgi:hypothetical protein
VSEDLGRKIFLTRSATSLTFSNRSGGSFTVPIGTDTTGEAKTTNARHDQQPRRMTFAEWSAAVDGGRQQEAAAPALRVVLPMLLPPGPDPTPEKTADAFTALKVLEDAADHLWHTSLFYPKRYPSATVDPDSDAALKLLGRAENAIWRESGITR